MASAPTDLSDTTAWSDETLDDLRRAVLSEQERRHLVRTAEQVAQQQADAYADAVKDEPAKEWTPGTPIGPGAKVVEGGKEYRNTSGTWLSASPSQYPMGYQLTSPPKPADVPAWKVGTDYKAGDQVSYGGKVYKALLAHRSQAGWEPGGAAASLWALA